MVNNVLRNLPSVNELLESPPLKGLVSRLSQSVVVARVMSMLDDVRREVQSAASDVRLPNVTELAERIARRIVVTPPPHTLRAVINATGVVFDPALGGLPLADEAASEAAAVGREYVNLEIDLDDGATASRQSDVESLLCEVSGAEAALVVGTDAAGVLLALAALGAGREVIVSRGQIVEIEPGSRLPDLATAAGVTLREVGATNHTSLDDYSAALGERTAAILFLSPESRGSDTSRTHVSLDALLALARTHKLPILHHLGRGSLVDPAAWDASSRPHFSDSLAGGAELVFASGDTSIGGPSCGMILGRRASIEKLARHPLARTLQADRMVLAALSATLRLYRDPLVARRSVPLVSLLATPLENLQLRAERLAPRMAESAAVATAEPIALPATLERAASWGVVLTPQSRSATQLRLELLKARPPLAAQEHGDRVLVDLRSVLPRQDLQLVAAVTSVGRTEPSE